MNSRSPNSVCRGRTARRRHRLSRSARLRCSIVRAGRPGNAKTSKVRSTYTAKPYNSTLSTSRPTSTEVSPSTRSERSTKPSMTTLEPYQSNPAMPIATITAVSASIARISVKRPFVISRRRSPSTALSQISTITGHLHFGR